MNGRRGRILALAAIILLGTLLRLAAIFYVDAAHAKPGENAAIARQLVEGNGFSFGEFGRLQPTSIRGPIYPFLLAAFDSIFGIDDLRAIYAALVLNVIAGSLAAVAAYAFVRGQIGERAAWIAAILITIWPTQIYAATLLQPLPIAVLLGFVTLFCLCSQRLALAIVAGISGAIAVLCEPVLGLSFLFAAIVVSRRDATHALLAMACAITFVAPWLVRNTIVHGQLTGITDTFWMDVFRGNGPDATGSEFLAAKRLDGKPFTQIDRLPPDRVDVLKAQTEIERVRTFHNWSIAWIGQHPLDYARLCVIRIATTIWLDKDHPLGLHPLNVAGRTMALMGFIAALLMPKIPGPHKAMLLVLLCGLALGCAFSLAEARVGVLAEIPQLCGLAAVLGQTGSGQQESGQKEPKTSHK